MPLLHVALGMLLGASSALAQTNIDLSGAWQYQLVTTISYPPPSNWLSTTVPGYTSSTNYARAWFRKTFTLPPLPAGCHAKLKFGGVKYNSTVYLNGQAAGGCYNGYDPFELDVTASALPGQSNELLVAVSDWTGLFSAPVDFSNLQAGESARDRANNVVLAPIGGHFNLFGIWEPVSVQYVPEANIAEVFVQPSVRLQQIKVRASLRNETASTLPATLHQRVLDGTNEVLVLPDQALNLPPGQTIDIETTAPWTSAKLWTPESPNLYFLESSLLPSGSPADTLKTRFGFREFWVSGDSFFLNGTKLHLLATSCWPPTTPTSESTISNSMVQIKGGNNKAIRLHTQPWPSVWYKVADEVGLLIVEEAAVWCDPRAYRLSDPVFWGHYQDHLRAAVKRDENHPALILWSLENEILHCGGEGIVSGTSTNLANLGLLVKSLDPTRPITFEADLDPGGVADVIGLHYPHEFPDFAYWPNTAYWMGQPISKSYAPGGKWQWDHAKPLYIGEHLWVADTAADSFSILYGDLAYFDKSRYRQLAKAWTWQMQIEAYRSYGVSAHCPWTMVEDSASGGIANLNTNKNLLFQAEAAAYHPNAIVATEYDSRFFTGENVSRTLTVYNDSPTNGDFILQWRAGGSLNTRPVSLQAGGQLVQTVSFTAPASAGPFNLELSLLRQGVSVFSNALPYEAYPRSSLTLPAGRRLGLYDPAGTTGPLLSGLSLTTVTNLSNAPYSQLDLLIIGRQALRPDAVPSVGSSTVGSQWDKFMRAGGRLLLLEQTNFPPWMPLGLGLVPDTASFAFPVAGQPVVSDLGPQHFRWWRGDNAVTRNPIRVPNRGNYKVVVHSGSQQGLDRAVLLEATVGRGGLLCSQLLLAERFNSEPLARVLLQRMLNYTSPQPVPHYAGLVSEPDSQAAQTLQRVGLVAENLLGRLGTADLERFPLLLVAGTNAPWTEANQNLARLQAYVEHGGRLVLHRPADSFLSAAGSSLLSNVSWSTDVSVPILRSEPESAPRRFTNYELYWADDAGSWNRPEVLATNIATRIYRKNFTLSSYTTLQVENFTTKTTGGAVTGGWGLYANGYVAQNITVAQAGSYLFGVVARGQPLGGVFPHMVLRIDGAFADSITVSTTNWQTFTLSAALTAGTHELALVFDNDAYAPPEDRNLYLDQVRYGLDPALDAPTFLTRPGAVVENRRGAGSVLFDEIAWETPGQHTTRADRYISTLLSEEGAWLKSASALRLEAEAMQPVGLAAGNTNNGVMWLYSGGRIEKSVRFTDTGVYVFELSGYGNPALGIYPIAELRIDGVAKGSVELVATAPKIFTLSTTVTAGTHTVAIAFINDYYQNGEDRNLALDYIGIQPQSRPEILDLYVPPAFGRCVLAWSAEPGKTYDVEYTGSLASPWQVLGSITSPGTAASWVDDGSLTGQPPGGAARPVTFYRIKVR